MTIDEPSNVLAEWNEFRDAMEPLSMVLVGNTSLREPIIAPEQLELDQGVRIDQTQCFEDGGAAVQLTIMVKLFVPDSDTVVARIESSWVISYKSPPNGERFTAPIQESAVYHLWPYVREFTTSMSIRMGLEPLLLPLVTPEEIKRGLGVQRSAAAETEPEESSS